MLEFVQKEFQYNINNNCDDSSLIEIALFRKHTELLNYLVKHNTAIPDSKRIQKILELSTYKIGEVNNDDCIEEYNLHKEEMSYLDPHINLEILKFCIKHCGQIDFEMILCECHKINNLDVIQCLTKHLKRPLTQAEIKKCILSLYYDNSKDIQNECSIEDINMNREIDQDFVSKYNNVFDYFANQYVGSDLTNIIEENMLDGFYNCYQACAEPIVRRIIEHYDIPVSHIHIDLLVDHYIKYESDFKSREIYDLPEHYYDGLAFLLKRGAKISEKSYKIIMEHPEYDDYYDCCEHCGRPYDINRFAKTKEIFKKYNINKNIDD